MFLFLSCMSSLYILDINPLLGIWFANIFFHSVGCLFILLMLSFAVQKLFSLVKSHLFCLREHIQKDIAKNVSVLPMFSFRSFMLSDLTFRCLIHFDMSLIHFCVCYEIGILVSFLGLWLSHFADTIYWRDYSLSIVGSLLLCCKLIVHICMGLFLGSQLCSIDLCLFFCQYHAVLIIIVL